MSDNQTTHYVTLLIPARWTREEVSKFGEMLRQTCTRPSPWSIGSHTVFGYRLPVDPITDEVINAHIESVLDGAQKASSTNGHATS